MKHDDGCGCHDHDHDHDLDRNHDHDHDHPHEILPELPATNEETTVYSGHGVQFRHPSQWTVQEESNDEQTTITVQSLSTAYWTLSLFDERPDPDQIVESVMAAYQEMYEELDVYEPEVPVLGIPVIARELDFVCLDLVSTASLIVFQTVNQTVLVIYQGEDREMETARPLLEAMTRSLACDLE